MSDLPPVIGFAGTAPISPALIAANLNRDLPDEVILVMPEKIPADSGLSAVRDWLCEEYEEGDIRQAELIIEALEDYSSTGHAVTLILLLDSTAQADMDLWMWASGWGIEVKDLSQNLITLGAPEIEVTYKSPRVQDATTTRPARDILEDITAGVERIKELLVEFEQTPEYQEANAVKGAPGFSGPRIAQEITEPAPVDLPGITVPPLPAGDTTPRHKYVKSPEGMYSPRKRGRLARGYTLVMLTDAEVETYRTEGKLIDPEK